MEFGKRVPHSSSLIMGLELCNEKLREVDRRVNPSRVFNGIAGQE